MFSVPALSAVPAAGRPGIAEGSPGERAPVRPPEGWEALRGPGPHGGTRGSGGSAGSV